MPEGDALHRAALRLQALVGRRVSASSPHPRGRATGVAAAVDGLRLESVEASGKHLVLRFEGGVSVLVVGWPPQVADGSRLRPVSETSMRGSPQVLAEVNWQFTTRWPK